jgi:hypothetical protein
MRPGLLLAANAATAAAELLFFDALLNSLTQSTKAAANQRVRPLPPRAHLRDLAAL